jgi:hypothetical protein
MLPQADIANAARQTKTLEKVRSRLDQFMTSIPLEGQNRSAQAARP